MKNKKIIVILTIITILITMIIPIVAIKSNLSFVSNMPIIENADTESKFISTVNNLLGESTKEDVKKSTYNIMHILKDKTLKTAKGNIDIILYYSFILDIIIIIIGIIIWRLNSLCINIAIMLILIGIISIGVTLFGYFILENYLRCLIII